MRRFLNMVFDTRFYSSSASAALLVLRLVVGAFMLTHGYGKFMSLIGGGPVQFADPIGIGATASLVLVVFAEFFCSIFLIFGFVTRLSSIPLIITMLVASLIVHANDGFMRQELPLLYATVYFLLLILGAGKYSVDYLIAQKISK